MNAKTAVCIFLFLFFITACSKDISKEIADNNTTIYEPKNITEIYVPIPDEEIKNQTQQETTLNDTYEIVKNTNTTCITHNDCETPGEYLILSDCPYSSRCINQTCAVVCPQPFKNIQIQYADMQTISVKECSERGGTAKNIVGDIDIICEDNQMMLGKIEEFISPNICCAPQNIDLLSFEKAREIAQEICTEQGKLKDEATYDAEKKMWNIELNVEQKECYPTCYISERTKKAEIGYKCVGAIPQHEERFVSKDIDVCKTLQYTCDINQEKFFSIDGCGCKELPPKVKHFCKDEERNVQTCPNTKDETCGWFDQGLTCREPPCVDIYDNFCLACLDEQVIYWTQGACPGT